MPIRSYSVTDWVTIQQGYLAQACGIPHCGCDSMTYMSVYFNLIALNSARDPGFHHG